MCHRIHWQPAARTEMCCQQRSQRYILCSDPGRRPVFFLFFYFDDLRSVTIVFLQVTAITVTKGDVKAATVVCAAARWSKRNVLRQCDVCSVCGIPAGTSCSFPYSLDVMLQMNVEGQSCSSCKPGTFHLSQENKDGCLSCFCMGVTQQCSSSTYYRDSVSGWFFKKGSFKGPILLIGFRGLVNMC